MAAVVMAVVTRSAGLLALQEATEVKLSLHAGHGRDSGSSEDGRAEEDSVDHRDGVVGFT